MGSLFVSYVACKDHASMEDANQCKGVVPIDQFHPVLGPLEMPREPRRRFRVHMLLRSRLIAGHQAQLLHDLHFPQCSTTFPFSKRSTSTA